MSLDTICSIILAALSAMSLLYAVVQTIKKRKQGASVSEVNAELTRQLEEHNKRTAVFDKIAEVINETEGIFAGIKNPIAKISYAITKLQVICVEQGVVIPEEELKGKIEKYLSTPQKNKSSEANYGEKERADVIN